MTGAVCQIDPGYGSAFRALRLESIRTEPEFLGWPYEDEAALAADAWNRKYRDPAGRVVFGAFAGDQLVGIMAVTTWTGDPAGRTALWNMTYVKPEYRHRKMAGKSVAQRLY
jgi:predicted GNAT superfamily acetyltransferase